MTTSRVNTVAVNTATVIVVKIRYDDLVDETFTIDELTAATGVPTRTIRQYQTAGLLSPPERKGRIGVYGAAHVERLRAIGRLQERGYSLAGMHDLFESWERGRPLTQIIGGADAQPEPPVDEAPLLVTDAQLQRMLPALSAKRFRTAAVQAGLITSTKQQNERGGWVVCAPSALAVVADLVSVGLPAADAIALHGEMHDAFDRLGVRIAETLSRIGSDPSRVDLLRRNRARLGRTAASLLVGAIGRALPAADASGVRVGAVRDTRADVLISAQV